MTLKFCTVDLIDGSIALSSLKVTNQTEARNKVALRIEDEVTLRPLRSKYSTERLDPLVQLEHNLSRLSQAGELASTEIVFGSFTDPFHPFHGKFDISIKMLELFSRYVPGHLTIQTRSPLVVIALPVLKRLGSRVSVNFGIETLDEQSVLRYTPGLPRVEERLKAITALRRFGIETNIQVSPVLPYGDWKNDALAFAKVLIEHCNFLHIQPFCDGTERSTRAIRNHATVVRMAEDRKFYWLRGDAAIPLIKAVESIDPTKLILPERDLCKSRQLEIFAA